MKKEETTVKIVDINVPFSSMVTFMVKCAFAIIPAVVLICVIIITTAEVMKALLGI
jgi:hypothetical protein